MINVSRNEDLTDEQKIQILELRVNLLERFVQRLLNVDLNSIRDPEDFIKKMNELSPRPGPIGSTCKDCTYFNSPECAFDPNPESYCRDFYRKD